MNILHYIFLLIGITQGFISLSQHPSTDPHYELAWSDEFNGTELDANKWTAYDWRDHGSSTGNMDPTSHPSVSRAQNVEVSNGTVKLHLKKQTSICEDNQYNAEWGYPTDNLSSAYYCNWQQANNLPYLYTSAEIRSNKSNGYTTGYGYYEAKCKISTTKGVWASFWTFKDFGETGNAGEIDIFETLGRLNETPTTPNPNLLKTNIHLDYCQNSGGGFSVNGNGESEEDCNYVGVGDLCTGIPTYDVNVCAPSSINNWHVYGLELTPNKIIWYIDGVVVRSMPNVGVITKLWVELGIVADAQYLGHLPNLNEVHEVDYFRFYKLKVHECKAVSIDQCTINLWIYNNNMTYYPETYKSITIGGSNCNMIPQHVPIDGVGYILRATDFVEISQDFSVPLGAELYIDVNSCYE
jgi:beta-glucanase (GH16 family)